MYVIQYLYNTQDDEMIIHIDHHSGVPIYRQIMDEIRNLILSRTIQDGQTLPSVRDLSKQLRVNPMTVSKAYAYLEIEGLVERQRGVGMFVRSLDDSNKQIKQSEIITEGLGAVVAQAKSFGISKEQMVKIIGKLYEQTYKGDNNE